MGSGLVAIVDDDEAVRSSAASLLELAGFDVKLFESGDSLLSHRSPEPISCILLDMQMRGKDGLAVLCELNLNEDSPPVIVITGHGDVLMAVEAMKLGALDFIEKPYDPAWLLARIEDAQKERRTDGIRADAAALVAALSRRQHDVLKGVLRGQQNKIIAFELNLSIRTVEAYRAQLLQKLGCRGTADAVRIAIAAGLLDELIGA